MDTITLVSLMAENARPIYQGIADYLSRRIGVRAALVAGMPWQEQERMLDAGRAEVGFICGLLYVQKCDRVELLAAPVMRGERYGGRPVYFSDVVVRHDSHFQSFDDLRGAALAYNDPSSFSGNAALRAHLAALGETDGFFGRVVESGGHLWSLALILERQVDAAAIDSTVLDLELARRPDLAGRLRAVAAIGPSPIPPVVVARHVPEALKQQLRGALLEMHEDARGRALLSSGGIAGFAALADADYDDIRRKARSAEGVSFAP